MVREVPACHCVLIICPLLAEQGVLRAQRCTARPCGVLVLCSSCNICVVAPLQISVCPFDLLTGYTLFVEDEDRSVNALMTRADMEAHMVSGSRAYPFQARAARAVCVQAFTCRFAGLSSPCTHPSAASVLCAAECVGVEVLLCAAAAVCVFVCKPQMHGCLPYAAQVVSLAGRSAEKLVMGEGEMTGVAGRKEEGDDSGRGAPMGGQGGVTCCGVHAVLQTG